MEGLQFANETEKWESLVAKARNLRNEWRNASTCKRRRSEQWWRGHADLVRANTETLFLA